jgi:tetratricopeptide (TPR) repeat protein
MGAGKNINPTEAIKYSEEARHYFLRHGFRSYVALSLYQKSIAQYISKDYSRAEAGLNEAYVEFEQMKNYGQMGYCVFHKGEMNSTRRSIHKALELFKLSQMMFAQMGNHVMITISLIGQAQMFAIQCKAGAAARAYKEALEIMLTLDGKEKAAIRIKWDIMFAIQCKAGAAARAYKEALEIMLTLDGKEKAAIRIKWDMQNISDVCEWGQWAFSVFSILGFLF